MELFHGSFSEAQGKDRAMVLATFWHQWGEGSEHELQPALRLLRRIHALVRVHLKREAIQVTSARNLRAILNAMLNAILNAINMMKSGDDSKRNQHVVSGCPVQQGSREHPNGGPPGT